MLSRRQAMIFPFFGAALAKQVLSTESVCVIVRETATAEKVFRADKRIWLEHGTFNDVSDLYIARVNGEGVMGNGKGVLIWYKGEQFQESFVKRQLSPGDILLLEIRTVLA